MNEEVYLFGRIPFNRRAWRRASGRQRREWKRRARERNRRTFGACPTCGQPGGPGHRCRMRFNQRNSERLRRRMETRGMPETPLWRGRYAS